jgi:hypothetical protein
VATNFRQWVDGRRWGVFYKFDCAGDGIKMHSHLRPADWHYTRCERGRVAVYGDGIDLVGKPGDTLTYEPFRMHEIVALEDGTEIVNECYGERPESFLADDPAATGSIVPDVGGRVDFSWPNNDYKVKT